MRYINHLLLPPLLLPLTPRPQIFAPSSSTSWIITLIVLFFFLHTHHKFVWILNYFTLVPPTCSTCFFNHKESFVHTRSAISTILNILHDCLYLYYLCHDNHHIQLQYDILSVVTMVCFF